MPLLYEDTDLIFKGEEEAFFQHLYSFARKFAPGRYEDAVAEAARIAKEKGIRMTVEGLKPVHFGWTQYRLPTGDTYIHLKENVRVYLVGLFSNDPDLDVIKFYEGAKITYLYDWFAKFVYQTKEKQAIMTPQPVFKNAFTFTVHTEVPKASADAWFLGYVVLPETMKEMKITY